MFYCGFFYTWNFIASRNTNGSKPHFRDALWKLLFHLHCDYWRVANIYSQVDKPICRKVSINWKKKIKKKKRLIMTKGNHATNPICEDTEVTDVKGITYTDRFKEIGESNFLQQEIFITCSLYFIFYIK